MKIILQIEIDPKLKIVHISEENSSGSTYEGISNKSITAAVKTYLSNNYPFGVR